MISNRADPSQTKRVELPCRCPGTPHASDSAQVVALFGYADRGVIRQAGRLGGVESFYQMMLLRGVISWTLTLPDGSARPVDEEEIGLLDEGTVIALVRGLDDAFAEEPVPKASSGRSRSGTRVNGTSTPTIPTPQPSTTG